MRIDNENRYHAAEINRDLYMVYFGAENVGQVRRGMDGMWYPELLPERYKIGALHQVVIAHEAIREFTEAVGGKR